MKSQKFTFKKGASISVGAEKGKLNIGITIPGKEGFEMQLFEDDGALDWFKKVVDQSYKDAIAHRPKKPKPMPPHLRLVPSIADNEQTREDTKS